MATTTTAPPPRPNHTGLTAKSFDTSRGRLTDTAQRVVIYGPGGVGKSTLAALIKTVGLGNLFLDLESETDDLNVERIAAGENGIQNFEDLRAALRMLASSKYDVVTIDNMTKAEQLITQWVLANVRTQKGAKVTSLEGYGYGKGYTHVYETFLHLLGDLDALTRAGKHIILICHDVAATVPNPEGDDFLQYQPRLISTRNADIRARLKEWARHVLFVSLDKAVDSDGKATGGGTRTIYAQALPTHMAKSRFLTGPYDYPDPRQRHEEAAQVWRDIFRNGKKSG